MTEAGFTIGGSAHPICPVMLGDARLASVMADDMLKLGETAVKTSSCLKYFAKGCPIYTKPLHCASSLLVYWFVQIP